MAVAPELESQPTLGSGSIEGRYRKAEGVELVVVDGVALVSVSHPTPHRIERLKLFWKWFVTGPPIC